MCLMLLLAGAVALAVVIIGYLAAEKRRKELAAFAFGMGLDFTHSPGWVHDRYSAFDPFDRGHSRRSRNLVHGHRHDIDWEMFDYRFKTGSGKNQQTHRYGVVVGRVPLALPTLRIRPEGFFDKLAAVVGFDDIDFESDHFSRKYHVSCHDRKRAYDLIHPQMIEYLLTLELHNWQFGGPCIIICRSRRYDVSDLPRVMEAIEGFVQRVPEYVRQDIGVVRPPPIARRPF